MGKKDTITKEYMSRNDIFADIFNYILYNGRKVIEAEDLIEKDSTEIALPIAKDGKMIPLQRYRDNLKGWIIKEQKNVVYMLLGIENQSDIHYAMPVKNLLYDAINYATQVNQKSAEYRKARKMPKNKKESHGEFLSGFHKNDKLKPVITVTIYFGTDEWDAPRNLREMFDIDDPAMENLLLNYQIPLILPKEIQDFEKFHSEFGYVMQIIGRSESKTDMAALLCHLRDDGISISSTAVEIIHEFTGISVEGSESEEENMARMCKALEDLRQEGISIGFAEGRQEGINIGLTEGRQEGISIGLAEGRQLIASQMKKEGFSLEMICKILQLPESNVKQLLDGEKMISETTL